MGNEKAKAMGKRLQITTKQPKNLQQLVGGKRGGGGVNVSPDFPGCFKCKGCKVSCPILNVTNQFQSTNTQRKYPIKQRLDCTSDWLIYLVTCKKCKGQYVGKSKTVFKLRHSNHKREVKNEIGGLGHHYGGRNGCGYQNLSITLIEQVQEKTMDYLASREVFWQHQLRVYLENGHGAHCYRKEIGRWNSAWVGLDCGKIYEHSMKFHFGI
jgi:hypothetical protein